MKTDPGFIAALSQSGGSTPQELISYGIKKDASGANVLVDEREVATGEE